MVDELIGPKIVKINGKMYLEVVFCCAGCERPIIRDSEEHDNCITKDGDVWYCHDCRHLCREEEEEEEEEEGKKED